MSHCAGRGITRNSTTTANTTSRGTLYAAASAGSRMVSTTNLRATTAIQEAHVKLRLSPNNTVSRETPPAFHASFSKPTGTVGAPHSIGLQYRLRVRVAGCTKP